MPDEPDTKDPGMRAAMVNSMMIGCTPSSVDQLLMVADALRIWNEHPELRNEIVAKRAVDPRPMLTRYAMVLALIKFSGAATVDLGIGDADYFEPEEPDQ
jgi:hypothetical protein